MPESVQRWEKERAAWVLTRAGHNLNARRRGELLMIRARRRERADVGVGDDVFSEVATRGLFHRMITREDGAANQLGWFLTACLLYGVLAFAVGPGIALAWIIYGGWVQLVPRFGRLKAWPLLLGAAVVLLAGAVVLWLAQPADATLPAYLLVQLFVGLVWSAWLTRAYGWAAVKDRAKASESKVKAVKVDRFEGYEDPFAEPDESTDVQSIAFDAPDITADDDQVVRINRPVYDEDEDPYADLAFEEDNAAEEGARS